MVAALRTRTGRFQVRFCSTDELIYVFFTKTNRSIMLPAHFDLGEDVFVPGEVSIGVAVEHDAIDLKKRDHFLDVRWHKKRVRFSRRLVHVASLGSGPFVFEILPLALDDESMHCLRVSMST